MLTLLSKPESWWFHVVNREFKKPRRLRRRNRFFEMYSILFIVYNVGEVSYNWIGTDGFEVKSETERFTLVCPRCRQNLRKTLNNNDHNQVFWARKTENPQQTIVLTETAG